MKPLVSTIIPVHNRPSLIIDAVDSVVKQTYRPIQIIIINDGSTDDTGDVIERLADVYSPILSVHHQSNAGPGVARQHGLSLARGKYIQFLDSDDLLLPQKFELQVAALEVNDEYDICYGKSYEDDYSFTPPRRIGPIRSTGESIRELFPKLLHQRWWTTSCPLYRMSLLTQIGPWLDLRNEEDWEYDARAGAIRAQLTWVPADVSVRRINICNEHLSTNGCVDPKKLIDRSVAQSSIFRSALSAGIYIGSQDMNHFSRSAFLLSRQCGVAGVASAARAMFHLARQAMPLERRNSFEFIFYSLVASIIGWCRAAQLAEIFYRLAKGISP